MSPKGDSMARKSYEVTAFNAQGKYILAQTTTNKANARRIAKAFLTYADVYTVDVNDGEIANIERFVKLGVHNGIVIAHGNTKNIRF